MASPRSSPGWWRLAPATRRLAAFALLAGLGVNLALTQLPGYPGRTTLDYTSSYLDRHVRYEDSWMPMHRALDYLAEPREHLLYEQFFHPDGFKFQYPPTSLLWLDALRHAPGAEWASPEYLNLVSWAGVGLLIVLVWRIFIVAGRRAGLPWGSLDRGVHLAIVAALVLTCYPVVRAFYLGQIQTWINVLFAGSVLAWLANRRTLAGTLTGLICVLKPTLSLLVVWALVRHHWSFARGWIVPVAGVGVLSIWRYGLANHVDYARFLGYVGRHGEAFYANQSVNGVLHRLLASGPTDGWGFVYGQYHPAIYLGTLVSSVLLLGVALWWKPSRDQTAELRDFLVVALAITMAAPIVWEHHYGVTLPMFAVATPLVATGPHRAIRLALLGCAFVLIATDLRILNAAEGTSFTVVQSYVLAGGLLLLGLLWQSRREGSSDILMPHATPFEPHGRGTPPHRRVRRATAGAVGSATGGAH